MQATYLKEMFDLYLTGSKQEQQHTQHNHPRFSFLMTVFVQ